MTKMSRFHASINVLCFFTYILLPFITEYLTFCQKKKLKTTMRRHYVDVFDFSWNTGCNKTINKRRNALLAAREE